MIRIELTHFTGDTTIIHCDSITCAPDKYLLNVYWLKPINPELISGHVHSLDFIDALDYKQVDIVCHDQKPND